MGLLTLADKISLTIQRIKEDRERTILIVGLDSVGRVKLRIQETGIDATGKKMGDGEGPTPYSDRVVPYWYFNKAVTNSNDAKKKAKQLLDKKGYFVSYADWRDIHGLPTDKVTQTFTGETWKNIQPVITESTDVRTVVELIPNREEEKQKYEYLNAQYGLITRLNEEEKRLVTVANQGRLNKLLNSFT